MHNAQCIMHNVECRMKEVGFFLFFGVQRLPFGEMIARIWAAKWHRYCVYQKKAVSLQCIMRNNVECIMHNAQCRMRNA